MGTMTQYECDRCGNKVMMKSILNLPVAWKYIEIQKYKNGSCSREWSWLLCPSCVKEVIDTIQRKT